MLWEDIVPFHHISPVDQLPSQSETMSEISILHRVCIHLNNAGLTLLSRHYHTEALEVLRDAVLIAEHSMRPGYESGEVPVFDFLGTKVERCAQLLAAAQEKSPFDSVAVKVVSDDSLHVPFIIDDTKTFYTVRIDYDCEDPGADYDASIHFATILINFGVAYMICARISRCASAISKYQRAASSLWNLANKIFVLHNQVLAESPRALLVGLFLYRVLIPSLYQTGRVEEARDCSRRLDETAMHLCAWSKVCSHGNDVAPAA